MKKYLWMSSAVVSTVALRVKVDMRLKPVLLAAVFYAEMFYYSFPVYGF